MPHIVVKMYPGRTDADKARLAEALSKAMIDTLGTSEKAISVGIEDVTPENWGAQVYRPEIAGKLDTIFKAPGYEPPA